MASKPPASVSMRLRWGMQSNQRCGMADAPYRAPSTAPATAPVGVGVASGVDDANQGVLEVVRSDGRPQSGLRRQQGMPNQPLVAPQPIGTGVYA